MEEKGIILNKWNGGMSNDEYAGGSFYYGENIDIRSNSKAFKLSGRFVETILNYRSNGWWVANEYLPVHVDNFGFTNDGYIESKNTYKDFMTFPLATQGGYLYKRASGGYINGIWTGKHLVGVTSSKLDAFEVSTTQTFGLGLRWSELITTPDLSANTGWTVNTGWTTGSAGATHTAGNVGTLEQTVTPGTGTGRLNIYIGDWTAGTLTVSYGGSNLEVLSIGTTPQNRYYTFNVTTSASDLVKLTPSTDFDGTVKVCSVRQYNTSKIQSNIELETSSIRPLFYDAGTLYIGSGSKIEVIDTTLASWVVEDGLILPTGSTLIDITKIGDVFNLYVNEGTDGIKYIWNGVDEFPSEKIVWKNKPFMSAKCDGNNDYVVCGSEYKTYLYVTNGYSRQLITQSGYMPNYGYNKEAYKLKNRFDYLKVLGFMGEKAIFSTHYGVYTYGTDNPGFPNSVVREWSNNNNIDLYYVGFGTYASITPLFSYRTTNKSPNYNAISEIREYNSSKQGYLVTNPIILENLGDEKILNKMRIGYLLPSSTCSINVYARVNDRHYITFYVSGVTTTPVAGDVYTNYNDNVFTVIKTDITGGAGTITCKAEYPSDPDGFSYGGTLTKTSGTGDSSISYSDRDNFIKIKTITTDKYRYGNELIFGPDFVAAGIPNFHKIQFKIELLSTSANYSPEIFDIPVLADITNNDLT